MSSMSKNVMDVKPALVFFDTETSGFEADRDILQIAMKHQSSEFNRYITPTKQISWMASEIHNLFNVDGDLYYKRTKLPTVNKRDVLTDILSYLQQFDAPCILIAHKCSFDSMPLIQLIREARMEVKFRRVIVGFTDTLPLFKEKITDGRSLKLTSLAADLSLPFHDAHDARYDAEMLETVAFKYLTPEELARGCKSFDQALEDHIEDEKVRAYRRTFLPLKGSISDGMIIRMAKAGISYNSLRLTYLLDGEQAATVLLEGRENGKPQIIKTKKVSKTILDCLKYTDLE